MIDIRFCLIAIASAAGVLGAMALDASAPVAAAVSAISAALAYIVSAPKKQSAISVQPITEKPERLDIMLDQLPAPIVVLDDRARIVHTNSAARALLGPVALDDPLAAAIRAPDLIDATEDTIADRLPRTCQFDLAIDKTGRHLAAEIRAIDRPVSLIENGKSQPDALILIEDRTQATRIENMRQDFIANASHELKTPLASIIGFIETLQGPARNDEEARARFLGIMSTQAERMKRLVEDLLSLNRIELNTHIRPKGTVDLGALSHEVAAALNPVAVEKEATITCSLPRNGPVVIGDRDQLVQLLSNFVDNALKYGGSGTSVEIGVAKDDPKWPGMTGVSVSDNGPGIARTHLPRLTERFYRVSAHHSRSVGGTGLGLAIAKHIAQRHRGDIAISSVEGTGSTFTLWLPA